MPLLAVRYERMGKPGATAERDNSRPAAAFLVEPFTKMRFQYGLFVLFLVLQGLAIAFTWSAMLWARLGRHGGRYTSLDDFRIIATWPRV